ncbi:hypothetical protein O3M35_005168 [Rhynocoris fuscipes]|uniref:Reverse transcriptase zinc-binding domain-containing protein n=1 Tax=Rhynocoris fuscipes TaxID=488301 RepID=A0AAW1DIL1_9HEMI
MLASRYNDSFRLYSQMGLGEEYIGFRTSIAKVRVVCQLRLSHKCKVTVYYRNTAHSIDGSVRCSVCNLDQLETLSHIFFRCPQYNPLRNHYLKKYSANFQDLFSIGDINKLNDIFYFTIGMLKLRSFCLNE